MLYQKNTSNPNNVIAIYIFVIYKNIISSNIKYLLAEIACFSSSDIAVFPFHAVRV